MYLCIVQNIDCSLHAHEVLNMKLRHFSPTTAVVFGLSTEFAGLENGGPKKEQRLENAGPGK